MSYETAPATVMLATNCACCGKELVDADSVEAGMGPVCRKRHGYAKPDAAPDWVAVGAALPPELRQVVLDLEYGFDADDPRRVANRIVHRIACDQYGPSVNALTNALRALGFQKLADRIENRVVAVRIERDGDRLVVFAPFREELVPAWRNVPGRRWDKTVGKKGANTFPASSGSHVWTFLRKHFAGCTGSGPKGLFTIEPIAA